MSSALAALAGAVGGFAGFLVGEIVSPNNYEIEESLVSLISGSAMWAAAIGAVLGLVILAFDNWQSLRGRWNRDLLIAVPLFLALGFVGGAAGQISFLFIQNSLTRGIGWALMGIGIGAGIGLLRRDAVQAQRGALGGAIGGFLGGFIFDALALVISDAGGGAFSRAVGLIITGAMIALLMRVVQDALKSAWLLCTSSGPYEGKEYPLNTTRVTVGAGESSDIALFREEWMPPQFGAFVFQNEQWCWQGGEAKINGVPQTDAPLLPGSTIEFGRTAFRFQTRSTNSPAEMRAPYQSPPNAFPSPSSPPMPLSSLPVATTPVSSAPTALLAPAVWTLEKTDAAPLRLPPAPAQAQLGRASDNDIVIGDDSVSSRHALLDIGGSTLSLTDLGSTNGTFVNGTRLAPNAATPLQVGDKVKLGRQEYSVGRS